MSDLAHVGYNHIDKLDIPAGYPQVRIKTFQSEIMRNSFADTGLLAWYLSIQKGCFRNLISPSQRPRHRAADEAADLANFPPKTPRAVVQLQRPASSLKEPLK